MCCCTANKDNIYDELFYLFSTNIREHSIKILVKPYNMKCVKNGAATSKNSSRKFAFNATIIIKIHTRISQNKHMLGYEMYVAWQCIY